MCVRFEAFTPRTAHELTHPSCIGHALKTCANELSPIAQGLKACADHVAPIAHPQPNELVRVARWAHPGQTCADRYLTIAKHVQLV